MWSSMSKLELQPIFGKPEEVKAPSAPEYKAPAAPKIEDIMVENVDNIFLI